MKDAPALEQVATSSLDALRSFAAGLRANDVEGDFPKAIPLFEDAIAKDSGFAAAYVQLAYSLSNAGLQRARQDSLFHRAFRSSRAAPRARALRRGGRVSRHQEDRPKAIAAYERAIAIDSSDAEALNSLAILFARRETYARAVQLVSADGRRRVRRTASSTTTSRFALANAGKFDAADSSIASMRERKIQYPTDGTEATSCSCAASSIPPKTCARRHEEPESTECRASCSDFLRQPSSCARAAARVRQHRASICRRATLARGATVNLLAARLAPRLDDAFLRGQNQRAVARLDSAIRAHPLTPATPPGAILRRCDQLCVRRRAGPRARHARAIRRRGSGIR